MPLWTGIQKRLSHYETNTAGHVKYHFCFMTIEMSNYYYRACSSGSISSSSSGSNSVSSGGGCLKNSSMV